MNRGRWLAFVLLSGFVVAVMAWTLWRGEPEVVRSTPLGSPAGTPKPESGAPVAPTAAIAEQGVGALPAATTDAGTAEPSAQPQLAAQPRPEPREPQQGGLDFLIETLDNGASFRVRARAALILGRTRSDRVRQALIEALTDPHPGVRVVAASGLGKQGPAAKAALEQAAGRERDRKVRRALESALAKLDDSDRPRAPAPSQPPEVATPAPTGAPRYYVGIGRATDPSQRLSGASLAQLDAAVRANVARFGGVRIAPSGESPGSAKQVLSSDARTGFYVDVSVASVSHDPSAGTRATVNVVVGTYPGRDMRAMLKGAATLPGGADDEGSRLAATQGALQSALRKLPGVFAQAQ